MKNIKLVLSGSGMLYPDYAGAIIRLAEAGYEISAICGVSSSAMIAAAVGTGYKLNSELIKFVKQSLLIKHNVLKKSWLTLFKKWGMIKSEPVENVISKFTAISMGEMKIPIYIACSNLTDEECTIFNSIDHPNMSVGKIVKASMSIPVLFEPSKINGKIMVDGSYTSDFPIDIFGSGQDTIGLRAISNNKHRPKINNFFDFIFAIFRTIMKALVKEHIEDAVFARTILIKSKFDNLNFNISDSQVEEMIREGYSAVDAWLAEGNS